MENTERYYKRLYLIYRHEDAVLSTADKTFSIRSIGLSNTVLVVTPVPDVHASDFADNALVIAESRTSQLCFVNEDIKHDYIAPMPQTQCISPASQRLPTKYKPITMSQ